LPRRGEAEPVQFLEKPPNRAQYRFHLQGQGLRREADRQRIEGALCAGGKRSFTIARFRARASSDNPTYLTQREHIREGMRKAALPQR
jgi:hypothetical protein